VTREDCTVAVAAAGKRLVFAERAEPVLRALFDGRERTIRGLVDLAPDLGGATIRALLAELVVHGLIMPE
jgi:hypothetical protein